MDKWPAGWLLVTPAWRGSLLSGLCLAIWAGAQGGGSHSGGGLAQPHCWGFQPQNGAAWTFHSRDRNPGQAPHPVPPPLYSLGFAAGLILRAGAGVVIPIEETEAQRGDVTCARTHSKAVVLLGVKPGFLAPILALEKESPQTL